MGRKAGRRSEEGPSSTDDQKMGVLLDLRPNLSE
jgi:hypothetical protein